VLIGRITFLIVSPIIGRRICLKDSIEAVAFVDEILKLAVYDCVVFNDDKM